jgi:hypothetical protein
VTDTSFWSARPLGGAPVQKIVSVLFKHNVSFTQLPSDVMDVVMDCYDNRSFINPVLERRSDGKSAESASCMVWVASRWAPYRGRVLSSSEWCAVYG